MPTKPRASRARNTATSEPAGANVGANSAARATAILAAAIMNQTYDRTGDHAFPADDIVDPRLRGRKTRGRYAKPGLDLALDAVAQHVALGASVHAACTIVARVMRNFWRTEARQSDLFERLTVTTLPAQLRTGHYNRLKRDVTP